MIHRASDRKLDHAWAVIIGELLEVTMYSYKKCIERDFFTHGRTCNYLINFILL